ncbi:YihY/virulence factor BrkB family protein [Leptospira sp. 201903074]|uniref:YihY/virulence factor BrkB family protein n=1 Tax=Leptospira abararensis TaxID=2810036 RepID=UPI001963F700|nr:YhjD/YihY/BrkB family envelope integrity protein [Leptospira abararensis]MBM9546445.1 YihY/virulence factor BrkB family protein [Leptospira abararensis]
MKRLRRFFSEVYLYDVHGLASELSFTFLLTLFPLLVVFVTLLGLLQDPKTINLMTDQIGKFLPAPIFQPIDKSVENLTKVKSYNVIALSIAISFFSSLTIFGTISKALRFISRDETKVGFIASQWINFRLLVISILLLVLYFYITFGLVATERFLFQKFRFGFFRNHPYLSVSLITLPYSVGLFTFYYAYITKAKTTLKENLPGAILASLLVLGMSFGFQWYLKMKNVGVNYSLAYDLISKMVVLMLYTYINSTFFIWGFLWNQVLGDDRMKKSQSKK